MYAAEGDGDRRSAASDINSMPREPGVCLPLGSAEAERERADESFTCEKHSRVHVSARAGSARGTNVSLWSCTVNRKLALWHKRSPLILVSEQTSCECYRKADGVPFIAPLAVPTFFP